MFVWSVLRNASVFRHAALTIDTDRLICRLSQLSRVQTARAYGESSSLKVSFSEHFRIPLTRVFNYRDVFRAPVLAGVQPFLVVFSPVAPAVQSHSLRSPIFPGTTVTRAVRFIEAVRPLVNHQTSSGERMRSRSLSLHWNTAVIIRPKQCISTVLTEISASFFVLSVYIFIFYSPNI